MNELVKGEPLVIVGPQGSGKTLRAIDIAQKNGTYRCISMNDLLSGAGLEKFHEKTPDTLIVEEAFCTKEQHAVLKEAISRSDAPNFIFVAQSDEYLSDVNADRRFRVLPV